MNVFDRDSAMGKNRKLWKLKKKYNLYTLLINIECFLFLLLC